MLLKLQSACQSPGILSKMQIEGGWGMARALLMISFLYYTQDDGPGAFLHSAKLSGESVCTDSTTLCLPWRPEPIA